MKKGINKKCLQCSRECKQLDNVSVIKCYKFQKIIDNVIKNYKISEEIKKAQANLLN